MEHSGRRTPPRVPGTTGFYASFPGGMASLRDLALRGAMLEDPDPLPVGSRIRLTLRLGMETVQCVGLVKRSLLQEGMAVEFVDISADDRRCLLQCVATAVPSKAAANRTTHAPTTAPSNSEHAPMPRIAELLVRRGAITAAQLAVAAAHYRARGGRLCALL